MNSRTCFRLPPQRTCWQLLVSVGVAGDEVSQEHPLLLASTKRGPRCPSNRCPLQEGKKQGRRLLIGSRFIHLDAPLGSERPPPRPALPLPLPLFLFCLCELFACIVGVTGDACVELLPLHTEHVSYVGLTVSELCKQFLPKLVVYCHSKAPCCMFPPHSFQLGVVWSWQDVVHSPFFKCFFTCKVTLHEVQLPGVAESRQDFELDKWVHTVL